MSSTAVRQRANHSRSSGLHGASAKPQLPITTDGDAVPARAAADRVPGDLRVHMRVAVDKAGRDDQPVGVDHPLGGGADAADLDDAARRDADIGAIARHARAVHDGAVLDQQVERHIRILQRSRGQASRPVPACPPTGSRVDDRNAVRPCALYTLPQTAWHSRVRDETTGFHSRDRRGRIRRAARGCGAVRPAGRRVPAQHPGRSVPAHRQGLPRRAEASGLCRGRQCPDCRAVRRQRTGSSARACGRSDRERSIADCRQQLGRGGGQEDFRNRADRVRHFG